MNESDITQKLDAAANCMTSAGILIIEASLCLNEVNHQAITDLDKSKAKLNIALRRLNVTRHGRTKKHGNTKTGT